MSFEWKRSDGSNIPVKSYYAEKFTQQFTTSTLIIPNVTDDDTGEYYCISWIGMQGSKSKTAILYLAGKWLTKRLHDLF